MSAPKILIAAAVVAILSTLVCALPRHIRSTDKQENKKDWFLGNYTVENTVSSAVCPVMVDYDIDESRVPRRIKVLKCAEQPSHCRSYLRANECCGHEDNHHHQGCVEVQDHIYVTYKVAPHNIIVKDVPVGCSCIIKNISEAKSMDTVVAKQHQRS